ncbi:hypothetical protein HZU75_16675 [Chitinibacter fontanus]|uniref:Uncharacterized protein n=1 Tax=Chitinibacter fontanus TaxID=1737446 RepID=A0A7D5ZG72_9NEIS|nr:hypothetical protein [Chitinibacter fontanus]QLI83026.1 hypothetical protein HZU75_16675 [Chitinibacter fontanus]
MPVRPSEYCDDLSAAIAQYLVAADEVLKRVDHLLHSEHGNDSAKNLAPFFQ